MSAASDEDLQRRVAALSPERRAMIEALLGESPAEPAAPQPVTQGELTPTERSLVAMWEQVLGTSGIGIHDDFFEIGGDSITAMRVAAKAQKAGLPITVRDIVASPTIAALAASVSAPQGEPAPAAPAATEPANTSETFAEADLTATELDGLFAD